MPIESIALPAPNAPSSLSVRLPSISELTQQACLPVSDKQMLPRGPLPTLGHLRQAVYSPTALPPSAKPSVPVTPKTAEHQPQQEAYQLHTPPAVSSQLSPRMNQLYYPQQYPNQVYPPSSYYPQPIYYTGQQHAPVPMPPQQGPAPPPPPAQGFQHQPGMMPPYPVHHHQYVVPEVINKPINKCHRCGTTETPEWRRGPNGVRTLCNACGLFHAKLVKRKGAALAAEEVLNNKVCKGKNGRRISIKKHLLNESLLKSTPILQPHPGAGAGNLPLPVVMNGGYPMYPLQMIRH